MATKVIYMEGEARYAKVFEHNRDMGDNLQPGDQKDKIEATQGQYVIDLVVTPEEKAKAIAAGIPDKGMIGMRWKTDAEGNDVYKAARKHFNPNMYNKKTEDKGVVQGPPVIYKVTEDGLAEWDFETDGYIGNGSKVVLKLSVWEGKIVDLNKIKVVEHVEFQPDEYDDGGF